MDWEVGSTSLACATCTQGFAEEQQVFSALYDLQQSFVRKDFCAGCWPVAEKPGIFSHWQTHIPKRDAPVRRFVDDEIVLDLFRRLDGQEDPLKKNFRYVLALLLMRKKTLKFTELRRNESGSWLVLYDKVGACRYEVFDPDLNEEQIQQVTEEVGRVLNAKV